ncbi:MAG: IS4 family transposase [Treponema sp.]|nr:IS4 family transposase [Spirochaetia bacterium]MDY3759678.1 IS4 family transposase [Treponema sp.]
MYKSITISSQLLALADRLGFEKICLQENADKRYRNFTARAQLYAMMIAQLTNQKGLRSIENAIASDNDLYHAGIRANITRTNLAHANEKRPCYIFQKFYFHLLDHYKFLRGKGKRKEEKNLKLIDATTISLNLEDFKWAKFRSTKGGIKINTRFNYDMECADYLFITNASKHENSTLKDMRLAKNDIAVFDMGYFNKKTFRDFTSSAISFVTRNKRNTVYEVLSACTDEKSSENFTIIRDEAIRMKIGNSKKNPEHVILRQVLSRDNETGKEIFLLTNMFDADALEIAEIYKRRWEVELFFKLIKQNLRVKRFYGQSENAVKTQIWIALIVHLLFLILKAENRDSDRTFSSFCSEISVVLFKHRDLKKWFSRIYEKSPPKTLPDKNELWLFDYLAS